MNMGRRGFLRGLLGAAAALTLDPERLLWVPGKKIISIPSVVGPTYLTTEMITFQMLEILSRNTILAHKINEEYGSRFVKRPPKEFASSGQMIGDTVILKPPARFIA